MLEIRGLTKRYGGLLAVDHVDFTVKRGEVLGYLGPNGSGKSTTVNMIVGLLQPGSGAILLNGKNQSDDPVAYKQRIGYVPEEPYLYPFLSGREYLELVGRLRELPESLLRDKIPAMLASLGIGDAAERIGAQADQVAASADKVTAELRKARAPLRSWSASAWADLLGRITGRS